MSAGSSVRPVSTSCGVPAHNVDSELFARTVVLLAKGFKGVLAVAEQEERVMPDDRTHHER